MFRNFRRSAGICPQLALCKMSTNSGNKKLMTKHGVYRTSNTRNLTVRYKVFGNDLSGTFSQLDTRHANYNGHSVFMYIVGHKPDPVNLAIQLAGAGGLLTVALSVWTNAHGNFQTGTSLSTRQPRSLLIGPWMNFRLTANAIA